MNDQIEWKRIEHDGITYMVRLTYDHDTKPWHMDCYTPADIEAWRGDQWLFVVVSVTPVMDDVEMDEAEAAYGSVEYGWLPWAQKWKDIDDVVNDHVIPDLIPQALDALRPATEKIISGLSDALANLPTTENNR